MPVDDLPSVTPAVLRISTQSTGLDALVGSMTELADAVASAVLTQFDNLPAKRKPAVRGNGLHDWVPLAGIVIEQNRQFTCVALASGMKCLPASKIPLANGVGIHDWHAEVLAIRCFNRYLLDECSYILEEGRSSDIIELGDNSHTGPPFRIRQQVKIHMYCSEAPCGDASMELTMAAQEDQTPWAEDAVTASGDQPSLPGRGFFSQLGIVRRKPARRDAPPTMSKSCSDKIAAKQCLSLLSSVTALFVHPSGAYINTLVLPEDRYSVAGCGRAFGAGGRMSPLSKSQWGACYRFKPFKVVTTAIEFDYSKSSVGSRCEAIAASNIAAAWTLSGVEETILGGVVQGRKAFDAKGASQVSRRELWTKARALRDLLDSDLCLEAAYRDIKNLPALSVRNAVKTELRAEALSGWVRNEGDDEFRLETTGRSKQHPRLE